ncbi:MobV family relaxase [Sporosarcina sp. A2]|uniref:MobV family relaxase n=1 Tax=Sporosarcina sp. A2 TaxID=3393449 RepID=UPI003D795033
MSFAVCRMQKMKSHDLKGIQFHNQRERESKTNPDIENDKSHLNYDFVNNGNIDYNERVKEIIESQKTGTRKTRKDAVLVNELLVTSDRHFFERLDPAEQKRFFEESLKLFSERYGEQNIAYATVHNDEKTPHLHIGVVPMRDGNLQGKNVFNRAELLWIQDKFPEHMKGLGFDLERGEKGSNREHIETQTFKKQTLEKEIDFLEKNIVTKKDELTAFVEKVESDLVVPAKRQMKSIEVPTGEKTLFGKEKTKTEKKPTENVIISRSDYKKMVTAAQDNEKLKLHIKNMLNTDTAKENTKLAQQNEQIKEKYNGLVQRFNANIEDYNNLLKENGSLKSRVSDLTNEIGSVYKSAKEFLKERTSDLKAFRSAFKDLVDKVKEKTPGSEFERLEKRERSRERNRGLER